MTSLNSVWIGFCSLSDHTGDAPFQLIRQGRSSSVPGRDGSVAVNRKPFRHHHSRFRSVSRRLSAELFQTAISGSFRRSAYIRRFPDHGKFHQKEISSIGDAFASFGRERRPFTFSSDCPCPGDFREQFAVAVRCLSAGRPLSVLPP